MKRLITSLIAYMVVSAVPALADGLLLPDNENYPNEFLRNRITEITTNITGLVAETVVYQEFTNDWDQHTDGVYSFPLPADARATALYYWRGDTVFTAVLKVKQQSTNPGTGEGGITALVNSYMGRNVIRLTLKSMAPRSTQKVELHYVQLCDYYAGEATWTYPLATGDFVTQPLDHLNVTITVKSQTPILAYGISSHDGAQTIRSDSTSVTVQLVKPKAYVDRDLVFSYTSQNDSLGFDLFSHKPDSTPGHFALFVRPPNQVEQGIVVPRLVVLAIGNNSGLFGYKLEETIDATSAALDNLTPEDEFNIMRFNFSVATWSSGLQPVTPENISSAKSYLAATITESGGRLGIALSAALAMFPDDSLNNSVVIFTDGRVTVDPKTVAAQNSHNVGLFFITLGTDPLRARIEMTADLNHGFVRYFDESDNLRTGLNRVLNQISRPIIRNVNMEFNRVDIDRLLPSTLPATYAGSWSMLTGRYGSAGPAQLFFVGNSATGLTELNYNVELADTVDGEPFTGSLWAKEQIDDLEREIEVYGETPDLKNQVIELSLSYHIRSRYTAFIATYSADDIASGGLLTDIEQTFLPSSTSTILFASPNPFNPETQLHIILDSQAVAGRTKLIKIYNALGQLINVIDISYLGPGSHAVRFSGTDFWGRKLPSGVYFARLEMGGVVSTIRITLMR